MSNNICPLCNITDQFHITIASIKLSWKLWVQKVHIFGSEYKKKGMITEESRPIILCISKNIIYDGEHLTSEEIDLPDFFSNIHGYWKNDLLYLLQKLDKFKKANYHSLDFAWRGTYELKHDTVIVNQKNLMMGKNYISLVEFRNNDKYIDHKDKLEAIKKEFKKFLFEKATPEIYTQFKRGNVTSEDIRYYIMVSNLNKAVPWDFTKDESTYDGLKKEEWRWREI